MHATMSAQVASQPRSPLAEDRNVLLARLVDGLDSPTLWWISGYSAGLAERAADTRSSAAPVAVPGISAQAVSVVYASQTGNARRTAEKLSAELEAAGIAVRLFNASVYPLRQLKSERLLYLVISTQGDGDPPDDGRAFVEHLLGPRAPKLPNLRYGVLGLGDSSYPQFNAIGRTLDGRLEQLGAERAIALGEADLDIDSVATPWRQQALEPAAAFKVGNSPGTLRSIPPVNLRTTAAKIPLPPSCFPTSASPPATATRMCATLNCHWQAPDSTTHPAMRWVSGQPTTPPWSTRSSNTCSSMAQRRSPTREKT